MTIEPREEFSVGSGAARGGLKLDRQFDSTGSSQVSDFGLDVRLVSLGDLPATMLELEEAFN